MECLIRKWLTQRSLPPLRTCIVLRVYVCINHSPNPANKTAKVFIFLQCLVPFCLFSGSWRSVNEWLLDVFTVAFLDDRWLLFAPGFHDVAHLCIPSALCACVCGFGVSLTKYVVLCFQTFSSPSPWLCEYGISTCWKAKKPWSLWLITSLKCTNVSLHKRSRRFDSSYADWLFCPP